MGVNKNEGQNEGQQSTPPPSSPVMGDAPRPSASAPGPTPDPEPQVESAQPSQSQPSESAFTPPPSPSATTSSTFQQEPRMSQQSFRAPAAATLNAVMSRPVGRRAAGEKVREFTKELEKAADTYFQSPEARSALAFHILDDTNDQVLMSTILVCLFVQSGGVNHVGVFEYIVEDESQRLSDLTLPSPAGPLTVRRTTADVADNELWEKAKAAIANRAGIAEENIHFAGSDVIPAGSPATDESLIHRLLFTSTQAAVTVLQDEVVGAPAVLTLKALLEGSGLQVAMSYTDGDAYTSTGRPARSNLSIMLVATDKNQQTLGQQTQSLHRKKVELTRVDGYIDAVYRQPEPPAYGQLPKTQALYPRFVMTRLDTAFDAITLEGQLLGLASAFTASYEYSWAGVFLPRFASTAIRQGNKKAVEMRDLGAVGLLVPLDEKGLARHSVLNTKTEDKDIAALVTHAFNREMLFTLHVQETGDLAWIQEVFVAAANGNQRALEKIVRAADNLTGNAFSQRWTAIRQASGAPAVIGFNDKIRLPVGYWTDNADGVKHDIREIDLIAVLNAVGEKDFSIVQRWQNAMDNVDMAPERRTEEIYKILDDVIGPGRYTVTDHVVPVTFAAHFLQALNEACVQAGADIRPTGRVVDFSGGQGRVPYGYLDQTAISPAALTLVSPGGTVGGGRSYQPNIHFRYQY